MEIIQYLNLAAEQHQMSDHVEDKLDHLIMNVLLQTETMSIDDLEHIQAAALPFGVGRYDQDFRSE